MAERQTDSLSAAAEGGVYRPHRVHRLETEKAKPFLACSVGCSGSSNLIFHRPLFQRFVPLIHFKVETAFIPLCFFFLTFVQAQR